VFFNLRTRGNKGRVNLEKIRPETGIGKEGLKHLFIGSIGDPGRFGHHMEPHFETGITEQVCLPERYLQPCTRAGCRTRISSLNMLNAQLNLGDTEAEHTVNMFPMAPVRTCLEGYRNTADS
jgi:hypothetical protein